jgi:DNA-binding NtrC family response regulator
MFSVYSVVTSTELDERLLEIGAAFPHDDGKGFNVVLDALPITPNLVVRLQAEAGGHAENVEPGQVSYTQHIAAFERALIERCLAETGGRISAVLERLAIPRRTLSEKMSRLGIDRRRFVKTNGKASAQPRLAGKSGRT